MSMREILFRAKRKNNGEWVDGFYCGGNERNTLHPAIFIYLPDKQSYDYQNIDINTLGQFTGLTDKNGIKIFEGDILKGLYANGNAEVEMINGSWVGYAGKGWTDIGYVVDRVEVIGNIHDNPELLTE